MPNSLPRGRDADDGADACALATIGSATPSESSATRAEFVNDII
jgi:hypothetical protein